MAIKLLQNINARQLSFTYRRILTISRIAKKSKTRLSPLRLAIMNEGMLPLATDNKPLMLSTICYHKLISCLFHVSLCLLNRAYFMLGIIKRNFINLTEDALVILCKSLVRCHLQYANSVASPAMGHWGTCPPPPGACASCNFYLARL